jgi:hypothetical protein
MNQRSKLKPIIDVPMVLQMESVIGQEAHSQFTGTEYRYSVIHDQQPAFIYLPPEGRDAIVRARPQVGDLVELLVQRRGRQQFFRAQVLSDGYEPPQDQPDYDERPPQPAQPTNFGSRLRGGMNGHRQLQPAPQAAPAPASRPTPVVPTSHPVEELIVRCYQVAARAVKAGLDAATEAGAPTDATFEDVSKTAISLFIDRRRGGDRT